MLIRSILVSAILTMNVRDILQYISLSHQFQPSNFKDCSITDLNGSDILQKQSINSLLEQNETILQNDGECDKINMSPAIFIGRKFAIFFWTQAEAYYYRNFKICSFIQQICLACKMIMVINKIINENPVLRMTI